MAQEDELTKVLESLVNDSEILKRDNAELQRLLAESREDLHALQEEVDEQRANPPPSRPPGKVIRFSGIYVLLRICTVSPSHTRHFSSSSLSSIKVKDLPVSSIALVGRNYCLIYLQVFGFSRRNPGSDHGMRIHIVRLHSP
jgi:hypothetical protein